MVAARQRCSKLHTRGEGMTMLGTMPGSTAYGGAKPTRSSWYAARSHTAGKCTITLEVSLTMACYIMDCI
eukprot:1137454-Pelagomonas_calceolata.AAC.3